MLVKAGLSTLLRAFQTNPKPISKGENSSPQAVTTAFANLDMFLLDLSMEFSDKLFKLQSTKIASRVGSQGSRMFLQAYKYLISCILDPENEVNFLIVFTINH